MYRLNPIRYLLIVVLLLGFVQVQLSVEPSSGAAFDFDRAAAASHDWRRVIDDGFGDRQNSTVWSMVWWQERLYVGTLRSFVCWRSAIWHANLPNANPPLYPPRDPDAECASEVSELAMQAEIWRWTPEEDLWERAYQSPQSIALPDQEDVFVARDTGYRGMLVFEEADGTEALYVTSVSPREMYGGDSGLPPPRILRTVDGVNFAAVPQDLGTFLSNLPNTSLRAGTVFNGRMYLTNGSARGEGILIEATDPQLGNNSFREVLPPETVVWDVIPYNGALYIGIVDSDGFSVVKTNAVGEPPYELTTVIPAGGYLTAEPSQSIVSMHEFRGDLYVGTFAPAELYRIDVNDRWELVVGEARETPQGWKYPTSNLDAGFGWPFNVQIYRMHEFEGALYIGTLDISREMTQLNPDEELDELLKWHYGFDLYRSTDGNNFEPVTYTGFDAPFQIAVRTFVTTPKGLFMGTGSYWYGLHIWHLPSKPTLFLPLVVQQQPIPQPTRHFQPGKVNELRLIDDRLECGRHRNVWMMLPLDRQSGRETCGDR